MILKHAHFWLYSLAVLSLPTVIGCSDPVSHETEVVSIDQYRAVLHDYESSVSELDADIEGWIRDGVEVDSAWFSMREMNALSARYLRSVIHPPDVEILEEAAVFANKSLGKTEGVPDYEYLSALSADLGTPFFVLYMINGLATISILDLSAVPVGDVAGIQPANVYVPIGQNDYAVAVVPMNPPLLAAVASQIYNQPVLEDIEYVSYMGKTSGDIYAIRDCYVGESPSWIRVEDENGRMHMVLSCSLVNEDSGGGPTPIMPIVCIHCSGSGPSSPVNPSYPWGGGGSPPPPGSGGGWTVSAVMTSTSKPVRGSHASLVNTSSKIGYQMVPYGNTTFRLLSVQQVATVLNRTERAQIATSEDFTLDFDIGLSRRDPSLAFKIVNNGSWDQDVHTRDPEPYTFRGNNPYASKPESTSWGCSLPQINKSIELRLSVTASFTVDGDVQGDSDQKFYSSHINPCGYRR